MTALPAQSPAPATWVDTAPAPSGRVLHAAQCRCGWLGAWLPDRADATGHAAVHAASCHGARPPVPGLWVQEGEQPGGQLHYRAGCACGHLTRWREAGTTDPQAPAATGAHAAAWHDGEEHQHVAH